MTRPMLHLVCAACACALAALSTNATAEAPLRQFAIVIGVNDAPRPEVSPLRYADDDAIAVHKLLREAAVQSVLLTEMDAETRALQGGFTAGGPPTLQRLREALAEQNQAMRAARQQGARVELIFFYSGHGDIDNGEGFVVLRQGRLTRDMLQREILLRSPADQNHVIVDACRSYFLAYSKGPGGERSPARHPFAASGPREALRNTGFVLSSSADQESHEWERFGAGIFSHEVRSGLRGAADANKDGQISYAELGAFLTVANQAIPNPQYRPRFLVRAPGAPPGELRRPILTWGGENAALELDAADIGHVYLEDAHGQRLFDAHPENATTMALRLPAERPLFLRRSDDTAEWVIAMAGSARVSGLEQKSASVLRKGALNLAFEKLFALPFGEPAVDDYTKLQSDKIIEDVALAQRAGPPGERHKSLRRVALAAALSAAAAGAAMTFVALDTKNEAEQASQAKRAEKNQSISRLNTGAVVAYSLAAAAAGTYLALWLFPMQSNKSAAFVPAIGPNGAYASATFHFSP